MKLFRDFADSRPCHLQNMASKVLFHCHYPHRSQERAWRNNCGRFYWLVRPRMCIHHFIHIVLEDLGLMATPIYKKVCKIECNSVYVSRFYGKMGDWIVMDS